MVREKPHEDRDRDGVLRPQAQGHRSTQKLEEAGRTLPGAFRVSTALEHLHLRSVASGEHKSLWFKLPMVSCMAAPGHQDRRRLQNPAGATLTLGPNPSDAWGLGARLTGPEWHQACNIGFLQSPQETSGLRQLWHAKDRRSLAPCTRGPGGMGVSPSIWDKEHKVGCSKAPPKECRRRSNLQLCSQGRERWPAGPHGTHRFPTGPSSGASRRGGV